MKIKGFVEKNYVTKKEFKLLRKNNKWIISLSKKRDREEKSYKKGKRYIDYIGFGFDEADITKKLLKRGFIKPV